MSPQKASLNASQRSFLLAFGSVFRSDFLPTRSATTMSANPIRRPGTSPAINRSPMDVSAMEPYTTKVMEGGMMTPMAPAAAINAAENAGL